jgi:hypothetical protein
MKRKKIRTLDVIAIGAVLAASRVLRQREQRRVHLDVRHVEQKRRAVLLHGVAHEPNRLRRVALSEILQMHRLLDDLHRDTPTHTVSERGRNLH